MSEPREDVDLYYLGMARLVSGRSTCVRRDVGAIIVDANNRVISTGYNGVPSGMPHCKFGHPCAGANCPSGTGLDLCLAIHAETNSIESLHPLHEADPLHTDQEGGVLGELPSRVVQPVECRDEAGA